MSRLPDTVVDYPTGATASTGTVLAVLDLPGGRGVVLDRTAAHPVDPRWPDQGPDRGLLRVAGVAAPLLDVVVGAVAVEDPAATLVVGADIPVRTGSAGWTFHVVHVVAADVPVAVGDVVEVEVDAAHRRALSAGHTACHLASLALDAALADAWRKEVPGDALGFPGFDALACESSRIGGFSSVDDYRVGRSLRRRGFDPEALADPVAVAERANTLLAEWVATGAAIRVERDGAGLGERRSWVCDLPGGPAVIPCGGTHLGALADLAEVRVALTVTEAEGALEVRVVTTARPAEA